ncbi:MAG: hypothetical protein WCI42_03305 [Verrucomicrobiota bacterium]
MAPQLPHLPKVPLTPRELGELAQLLFEWPIKQAPRLALPLFILLATVMQASVIILFSITYKVPSEKFPPPPQIYFLPADSAAARQLAPWLEANDPAVFSPQHAARNAFPSPPPLKYKPSYEDPPPPPRPLPAMTPESAEAMQPPMIPVSEGLRRQQMSEIPATETIQATNAPTRPAVGSSGATGTIVRWQDELADRKEMPAPQGPQEPPRAVTPGAQAPLYQVAISPEGIPTHCVLIDSSGDPKSDEAGRVWIMAQRFQPTASSSWGRVLMLWGDGNQAMPTNSPVTP